MFSSTMSFRLFLLRKLSTINNVKYSTTKNPAGGWALVQQIAETDDGKTIVGWHPKIDFPYEFSRPLPQHEEANNSSLIKETALNNAMKAFKDKHPEVSRQELMNLTYTTKHRWFPRARDKKAKKTPMDRPYL